MTFILSVYRIFPQKPFWENVKNEVFAFFFENLAWVQFRPFFFFLSCFLPNNNDSPVFTCCSVLFMTSRWVVVELISFAWSLLGRFMAKNFNFLSCWIDWPPKTKNCSFIKIGKMKKSDYHALLQIFFPHQILTTYSSEIKPFFGSLYLKNSFKE